MPDEEVYVEALKKSEDRSLTCEERLFYHYRAKNMLDEWSAIREAELRVQEAREKALAEGRMEGRALAKIEGKIKIARKFLEKGFDLELIMDITGLEKEDIINSKGS